MGLLPHVLTLAARIFGTLHLTESTDIGRRSSVYTTRKDEIEFTFWGMRRLKFVWKVVIGYVLLAIAYLCLERLDVYYHSIEYFFKSIF